MSAAFIPVLDNRAFLNRFEEEGAFFATIDFTQFTIIILLSIGSDLSKRETDERRKFRILFNYSVIALLIILIALPWPFSPLAQRPWFRAF